MVKVVVKAVIVIQMSMAKERLVTQLMANVTARLEQKAGIVQNVSEEAIIQLIHIKLFISLL